MAKWVQGTSVDVDGADLSVPGPVLVNLDVLEQLRVCEVRGAWMVVGFPVGSEAGYRVSSLFGDQRSAKSLLTALTGVQL